MNNNPNRTNNPQKTLTIYCGICSNIITQNHHTIECKHCNCMTHLNCNEINLGTFKNNKGEKNPQTCINCKTNFPFQGLTNIQLCLENNCNVYPTTEHKWQCSVCNKTIAKNHRTIICSLCNKQTHIKCNHTDVKTYNKIINDNLPQICYICQTKKLSQTLNTNQKPYCEICNKIIAKNHKNIHCESCNNKIHIKCNKIDVKSYNKIIKNKQAINCIQCMTENIPFQNLTDIQFFAVNKGLNTDTEVLRDKYESSNYFKI